MWSESRLNLFLSTFKRKPHHILLDISLEIFLGMDLFPWKLHRKLACTGFLLLTASGQRKQTKPCLNPHVNVYLKVTWGESSYYASKYSKQLIQLCITRFTLSQFPPYKLPFPSRKLLQLPKSGWQKVINLKELDARAEANSKNSIKLC